MSYSITLQEFSQVPSEKPLTQPQMKLANEQVQKYLDSVVSTRLESVINTRPEYLELGGFNYYGSDYRIDAKKIVNQPEYNAAREEWLEEVENTENVAQVVLGYAEITKLPDQTTTDVEERRYYALCYKIRKRQRQGLL